MKKGKKYTFSIKLVAAVEFLHVATSFVEKSAIAFGLSGSDTMRLVLATEEIFVYLCKSSSPEKKLEINCIGRGWFVMVDFALPVNNFNLRSFNITSTASPDSDAYLEEMGLFLASRQVDRFHVTESGSRGMSLSLIKEKTYPAMDHPRITLPENSDTYSIRRPDSDEIKLFASMAEKFYPHDVIPPSFAFPGKVVDMLDMGDYDSAIASDPSGRIGGGIIWQWSGPKTIEFFGPYIFNGSQNTTMAAELLHACISAIARTHAVALISRLATDCLPEKEFELLGTLNICTKDGKTKKQPAYFRQMQEDAGCIVKSHPDLNDFLQSEYTRLVLPREIQLITDAGEQQTPYSVITADFDKNRDVITLKPIRAGTDALENLTRHVNLFAKQSTCNLFFEMDLAFSWHASFTPALLKNGFIPKLIIPYAGQGDLAIFQWEGPKS